MKLVLLQVYTACMGVIIDLFAGCDFAFMKYETKRKSQMASCCSSDVYLHDKITEFRLVERSAMILVLYTSATSEVFTGM